MPSRITQSSRAVPADAGTSSAGGSARITQSTRAALADDGTRGSGGSARVTQSARVVISTIQFSAGGLRVFGVGS